jgi:hypothetical protein
VTDEVMVTDELLIKFDDKAYEGKYYTLVYLYCLKTGEKYYLNKAFGKSSLADVWQIPVSGDSSQIVFLLQNQELLTVSLEEMTTALKNDQRIPLMRIEEASEDHQLMRVTSDEDRCLYRVHDEQAGKDSICSLNIEHGQVTKQIVRTEMMPKTGEIVYDPDNASAYQVTTSEQGMMHVENLSHPEQALTYNPEHGEFTGIATSDLVVTKFYDTQMLKDDMVFKECVAIHHIQDGTVEIFEGTCEKRNGQLLILRSFLFL